MNGDMDVMTRLLLDPCLTADEAAREAAALAQPARSRPRPRPRPEPVPAADDRPAVGF